MASNLHVFGSFSTSDEGLQWEKIIVLVSIITINVILLIVGVLDGVSFLLVFTVSVGGFLWASRRQSISSKRKRAVAMSESHEAEEALNAIQLGTLSASRTVVSPEKFIEWYHNELDKVYGFEDFSKFADGKHFANYSRLFDVKYTRGKESKFAIQKKYSLLNKRRPMESRVLAALAAEFEIQSTYYSNWIEGVGLPLKETELVIHHLKHAVEFSTTQFLRTSNVSNHINAWNYALTLVSKDSTSMNLSHLCEIQRRIEPCASLRSISMHDAYIGNTCVLLPLPHEVDSLLAMLFDNFHSEVRNGAEHIVDLIIAFHARFARIHPFEDGNGRTIRIFTSLLLMQHQYPPLTMEGVEPNAYKDALYAWDNGDPEPLGNILWDEVDRMLDKYLTAMGVSVEAEEQAKSKAALVEDKEEPAIAVGAKNRRRGKEK